MTAPELAALRYPGFCDAIDVSQVQTVHDYKAVADEGFVLAIAKASEGLFYCDPRILEFLKGFRDVGMLTTVYTFLRPSQGNPREQVRKAYECAGGVFVPRLVLDLEGAPDGMSDVALIAFAEEAIDETQQNGVTFPTLYSFPYFVKTRLLPALARSTLVGRCGYHGADYGSNTIPTVPHRGYVPYFPNPPFDTWTLHQYSGNGGFRVKGIYGDVDRNLFNGDRQALCKWLGGISPPPDDRPTSPDGTTFVDEATVELGAELGREFLHRKIGE